MSRRNDVNFNAKIGIGAAMADPYAMKIFFKNIGDERTDYPVINFFVNISELDPRIA